MPWTGHLNPAIHYVLKREEYDQNAVERACDVVGELYRAAIRQKKVRLVGNVFKCEQLCHKNAAT